MAIGQDVKYARYYPYLEMFVEVTMDDVTITAIRFMEESTDTAGDEHEILDRIEDYLSGTVEDDFKDVQIALPGSEELRAVLSALRAIPYGQNASVESLARDLDEFDANQSKDHERIRAILDQNPIPLIIPDHRVRDGPSAAPPEVEQRLRSLEKIAT